jgi:hypothetical protein
MSHRRRGPRPRRPELTVARVLAWADAYHRRRGRWPQKHSGPVAGGGGETWRRIDDALAGGYRGLPGGSSLAQLLAQHRGLRNPGRLPRLTQRQVLAWADAHRRRTGAWPNYASGPVPEAPGETWIGVDSALRQGWRGLPGGSSLARLLARHRGVRNLMDLPRLTEEQVLAWADAHRHRTGAWPNYASGPVPGAAGENWLALDWSLRYGHRGLPGGASLARLLERRRGVRNLMHLPRLARRQVLAWADAHHGRTGEWPSAQSGPIPEAPGETWRAVDTALRQGGRGLPGGSSLARLLERHRGVRNPMDLPPLMERQILAWADAHRRRTGAWPKADSGPIPGTGGESWSGVDSALRRGGRGLRGGSSLHRLIEGRRRGAATSPAPRL